MRVLSLSVLAALLVPALAAQTVPSRGADDTFDVGAWNVEHFGNPSQGPSNDATQIANVEAVIAQAEVDLWALEEIGSTSAWSTLLTGLQDDGYAGRLGESTGSGFELRLAFVYNPSVVQVIGTRHILTASNFGGRRPFEMQARVTAGGQSRTIRVIALHAKATADAESYAERVAGAAELKTYIDDQIARGEQVILMGDFNDFLTRSIRSGQLSPYRAFIADDAYVAATLPVEQTNRATFCGNSTSCTSGSTIDHIVFTSGLSDVYVDGSGDRFAELITGVSNYVNSTSDHLPVLARFSFLSTNTSSDPDAAVALLPPAPNPVRAETRLRFRLDAPGDVALDVFDALGRRVARLSGTYGAGEHRVRLDTGAFASGVYVVRLQAAGVVATQRLVRAE